MADQTSTPNFGFDLNNSSGVGFANNTFSPNNANNPLNPTNAAQATALKPVMQFGPSNNNSDSSTSTNTSNSNSGLNSNAVSIASQTAQHSGLFGNTLGTLTSGVDSFGAGTGLFSAPAAAETVSPAVAAADAASTASFAGGTEAAMGTTGLATSATGTSAAGGLGITLSGTLGAAGLGAIGGGMLAKALGGNPIGGSIGGAIGAGGGMLIGAQIGAIGGPLGALIGGTVGALGGMLFGNNTPATSDTTTTSGLTSSGSLQNTTTASKNPSSTTNAFVASAQENFSSIAGAASTALGIQFNPGVKFVGGDSTRYGGAFIDVDSPTGQSTGQIFFNPSDPSSSQQAYAKALTAAATYSGYTDTTNLTNWYNNTYVNTQAGATNQAPSLPNNPNAATSAANTWQQFLSGYTAQQNAGAAPVQTTVGGQPISSAPTQGTTNANAKPSPSAAAA